MSANQKMDKYPSKYKFNILDAFIILVVVLCIIGIYFRSNIESWIGDKKDLKEYQITFVIEKIKSTSDQYINVDDVIMTTNGVELGTVSSFSSFPAKEFVSDGSGGLVEVNYPENTYIDVTVVVNCMGAISDEGFYLNGTYLLSPGTVVNASTEVMDFTFTVTDITEKIV